MKKIVFIIVVVGIIGAIVGILMMNKKTLNLKKTQSVNISEYPVQIFIAQKQVVDEVLNLIGSSYPNAEVQFNSETIGRVTTVKFDVGERVGKGNIIATVDDELKQAALITAEASFDKSKNDLDRTQQLFNAKSANESQLDIAKFAYKSAEAQLIIAKRQLKDTKIVCPINGIVSAKSIETGAYLNTGNPIATIVDISTLKVKVNISEKDVIKIKMGDKVKIKSEVYPDQNFVGIVKAVNPKADESHTYSMEINLPNPKSTLKAGMFFTVYFDNIQKGESLVIPRQSLVGSVKDPQVYVVESGIANLRKITIADIVGDKIEVLSGINQGEQVVISGQINLKDKSPVKIVK